MKILLIYPFLNNPNHYPPFGIVYLGTYLRKFNFDVKLLDLTFSRDFSEVERVLKRYRPDIVGISVLTIYKRNIPVLAQMAKSILPESLLVCGGPHATARPEELLEIAGVGIVAVGEGEKTLLDIARHVESNKRDFNDVDGICYKKDGKAVFTRKREFIPNLDDLGIPDRGLLPTFEKYLKFPTSFPYFMPHTYFLTARGCPFQCTFCQPMLSMQFGNKIRQRSAASVLDEMEMMIAKYGLKSLYFADETFLTSKKWGREICQGIIARGINKKISWMVQTNVRTFDEESAKFMSDSGCIMVLFGAESGCDAILRDVYKKPQTKKQIIDAFKIARKYNMITEASLIVGCVEETQSSLQETVDLVSQLKADFLDVHYLTPTPGSALYDSYSRENVLNYTEDSDPDRYTPGLLRYKHLTGDVLVKYRNIISSTSSREQKLLSRKSLLRIKYVLNVFRHSSGKNPLNLLRLLALYVLIPQSRILTSIWNGYYGFRLNNNTIIHRKVNRFLDWLLTVSRLKFKVQ